MSVRCSIPCTRCIVEDVSIRTLELENHCVEWLCAFSSGIGFSWFFFLISQFFLLVWVVGVVVVVGLPGAGASGGVFIVVVCCLLLWVDQDQAESARNTLTVKGIN